MFNPVTTALLIVPIGKIPVKAGDNAATVPDTGENTLFGVVDSYSCAQIVTVVPINDNATVVLK